MCSQPSFYFLTFCYNCIRPLCVGERIFLNETPQIDLKTLTLSVAFLTLSFSWLYAFSSIELASAAPIKIMSLATISLTSVIHIVIFKECKGNLLFACSAIIHFWRFTKMSVFKKLIFILTSPMSWQTFHRGLLAMQASFFLVALSIFKFILPVSLTDFEIHQKKRDNSVVFNVPVSPNSRMKFCIFVLYVKYIGWHSFKMVSLVIYPRCNVTEALYIVRTVLSWHFSCIPGKWTRKEFLY